MGKVLEARVYFLWRGAIKLLQDRWLLLNKSLFSEESQSKTQTAGVLQEQTRERDESARLVHRK